MTVEAVAAPAERGRTIDFIALAKPRLNLLVVLTACVGFYLGAGSQFDPLVVVATIVGTTPGGGRLGRAEPGVRA